MAKWQIITTDVAHRSGVVIMRRGGLYKAFEIGSLRAIKRDGEAVEASSYASCVAQLF